MLLLAFVSTYQLLLIAAFALIPVIALVDIMRSEFSGNNKTAWLLVVLLAPGLGVILYLIIGMRQKVRKTE